MTKSTTKQLEYAKRMKEYYKKNKKRLTAYKKKYYKKNKKRILAQQKKYRAQIKRRQTHD